MTSLKLLWLYRGNLHTLVYVALRRLICPFKKMEKLLGGRKVVADIGCGQGLFSVYCTLKGHRAIGFDPNGTRLKAAAAVARSMTGCRLILGNFSAKSGSIDAACLSDVLHHIPYEGQKDLLTRVNRSLKASGTLIVKEICLNDGWRYSLSAFSDKRLYPAEKCFFRSQEDWIKLFTACDFSVKHYRTKSILSTNIFIASRGR